MRESEESKFFTSTFVSGVGDGDGEGAGRVFLTATPLLHTNFLPDLMQVCLIAAYVIVWPCFEHAVPGFTAAVATGSSQASARVTVSNTRSLLRIIKL